VRAALELIAEKGPAGFTFADAARWAGVSPAAPYRHFRDRDELLSDVARRGFEQFTAAQIRALLGLLVPGSDAVHRVTIVPRGMSLGATYQLPTDDRTSYSEPYLRARIISALGGRAAEKLVARMPEKGRPPSLMVALHIWSLTHGIASLFSRGDAARRALPMPPEELLEAAFLIYLRGLGLPAGRTGGRD